MKFLCPSSVQAYWRFALILVLFLDFSYSFFQHLGQPLDGDMAGGIVPANEVNRVLQDPFGCAVLLDGEVYPNPNRFFSHYFFFIYFRQIPLFLQHFVSPIESPYWAAALFKTLLQMGIIGLLACYISAKKWVFDQKFLLAAALILPLFQTNGYHNYMGIIDQSITYTFFYALPCAFVLLFYLPYFLKKQQVITQPYFFPLRILLFGLAVLIVFSGPLNPGICLVLSCLLCIHYLLRRNAITPNTSFSRRLASFFKYSHNSTNNRTDNSADLFFWVFPISILSLYSLYIGQNNAIFLDQQLPLLERYLRLPHGFWVMLTTKIGYGLFVIMLIINVSLTIGIRHKKGGDELLQMGKWIAFFALLYVLLLPLGGYKDYRPYTVRYDTMMPVNICLLFFYARSTMWLLENLRRPFQSIYLAAILLFSLNYMVADEAHFSKNACEKAALKQIATAQASPVLLENDCRVLSWRKTLDPKTSELNGLLLQQWNIAKEAKTYYQK